MLQCQPVTSLNCPGPSQLQCLPYSSLPLRPIAPYS
uniref:Uncharacterized protein n=1 Tax=Arundo donax TaxID=35708 RepID=A0A0A9GGE7_ARUDO